MFSPQHHISLELIDVYSNAKHSDVREWYLNEAEQTRSGCADKFSLRRGKHIRRDALTACGVEMTTDE